MNPFHTAAMRTYRTLGAISLATFGSGLLGLLAALLALNLDPAAAHAGWRLPLALLVLFCTFLVAVGFLLQQMAYRARRHGGRI